MRVVMVKVVAPCRHQIAGMAQAFEQVPFILQFTTASIRNDMSRAEAISSATERPLSLRGASFVPHKFTPAAEN